MNCFRRVVASSGVAFDAGSAFGSVLDEACDDVLRIGGVLDAASEDVSDAVDAAFGFAGERDAASGFACVLDSDMREGAVVMSDEAAPEDACSAGATSTLKDDASS